MFREDPGSCGELREENCNTEWYDEPIEANRNVGQARGPKEDDKNQEVVQRECKLADPLREHSILERTVYQRRHEGEADYTQRF